jgi:hypothetical protein
VEAKRSRVAAVIDSGSMPTTNGVDFRRRAASHSAAATIGDLCATTILAALNLLMRLRTIAAIGKKDGARVATSKAAALPVNPHR